MSGAAKLTRDLEALFEGLRRLGLSGKQAKKMTGSVSKQVSLRKVNSLIVDSGEKNLLTLVPEVGSRCFATEM